MHELVPIAGERRQLRHLVEVSVHCWGEPRDEPGVSSYFLTLFGRSDRVTACACERNGEVTLPQLLHLQNGDATVKKVRADQSRLKALLKDQPDDLKVIEELFLTTMNRRPSADERASVQKALGAEDREESFRDLFWALLNSKEFAFNH